MLADNRTALPARRHDRSGHVARPSQTPPLVAAGKSHQGDGRPRYRDNRNDTAHDYGEDFAETTLKLLPAFVQDAKALASVIDQSDDG